MLKSAILNTNMTTETTQFLNLYSLVLAKCVKLRTDNDEALLLEKRIAEKKKGENLEKNNNKQNEAKKVQNDAIKIIFPDYQDDIIVPNPITNTMSHNFVINWLKEQYLDVDQKNTEKTLSDSDFSTILKTQIPILHAELTDLSSQLPYISDKVGVNSIMSAVGAGLPLSSTLQNLSTGFLSLFQKDEMGRTFLHHLVSSSQLEMLPPNQDDAEVYMKIYKDNYVEEVRIGVDENGDKSDKSDKNDKNKTILAPISDNRLECHTHPSMVPAPMDIQPFYLEYQQKLQEWERKYELQERLSRFSIGKNSPPDLENWLKKIKNQNWIRWKVYQYQLVIL